MTYFEVSTNGTPEQIEVLNYYNRNAVIDECIRAVAGLIAHEGKMIPTGELRLEVQPMAKPKPTGCGVFVDGKMVAVLTLENVKAIAIRISELEAQRL